MRRLAAAVAAAACVLAFAACGGGGSPPAGQGAVPLSPKDVTADVNAVDFWMEYHKDQVAAEARYKGKVLRVAGPLQKIGDRAGHACVGYRVAVDLTPRADPRQLVTYPPGVVGYLSPTGRAAADSIPTGAVLVGRCKGAAYDPTAYEKLVIELEDCEILFSR